MRDDALVLELANHLVDRVFEAQCGQSRPARDRVPRQIRVADRSTGRDRGCAPRNPHRQQCGGNRVRASSRDRRPRSRQPETAPLVDNGLPAPEHARRFRALATRAPARKRCKSIDKGVEMNTSVVRHDWTRRRSRGAVRAAVLGPDVPRPGSCIARNHRPNAVQMSTLLSIKTGACPEDCAYCPQSVRYDTGLERETLVPLDEVRTRAQAREGRRRDPLLHGRRLALAEEARRRSGRRDDPRSARAGHGDLRDARHAHARAGARTEGRRPRLLQPQRRHLARVLRRDHHHAHLPGSSRHARRGARRGPERVLRRHRRHGRDHARSRLDARDAGEPSAASRERADQPAGARAGHAARRPGSRWIPSISCAPLPWRAS